MTSTTKEAEVNIEDVDFNKLIGFLRRQFKSRRLGSGRMYSSMIVDFEWLTDHVSIFLDISKYDKKGNVSRPIVEAMRLLKVVGLITSEVNEASAFGDDLMTWRLVMRD